MRRYIILFVSFILLLGACSTVHHERQFGDRMIVRELKQQPPEDFFPEDISIVAIGDSLTEGVGDVDDLGGYIQYLKNLLENEKSIKTAEFENYGKKGNRTDQLLQRLDDENIQSSIEKTNIVIITIGGNDIMQVFRENLLVLSMNKFSTAEISYRKRLDQILATVRSYNQQAEIILIGIYNPFIRWFSDIKEMDVIVENWNTTSEKVVSQYNQATFVPVADIFLENEENLLFTDYFHPNNRGYELIAERIFSILKETGELKYTLEKHRLQGKMPE